MAKRHMQCIGCRQKLRIVHTCDNDILVNGGNCWYVSGQYGSKFDGDPMTICICDECLEDMEIPSKNLLDKR